MQVIGLAEIRLAEDFSYEGALELNFKAENTRNSQIFFGEICGFGGDMAK